LLRVFERSMNDNPSASEECLYKGRHKQQIDLHLVVPVVPGAANTHGERKNCLLCGLRHLRHARSRVGRVYIARDPLGSVDLASCGDRGCGRLDAGRIPAASLRAASNAVDRRSPLCASYGTRCLRQHADVGKSASFDRFILCPNVTPVFAQCRVRSDQRADHRLALVRGCASRYPLSPAAPAGIRPEGCVASTSSSSFVLSIGQFRRDDGSMGLPVWHSHLVGGTSRQRLFPRALELPVRPSWRQSVSRISTL